MEVSTVQQLNQLLE